MERGAENSESPASETLQAGHFQEYLMEGAELGIFMIAAGLVTVLLYHPDSPLPGIIPDPLIRRILTGIAMGLTAIGIIYSPWGKQSGAHFNPAVTLTFYRLGKMRGVDAIAYCVAHFAGGLAGTVFIGVLFGSALSDPAIRYASTIPGEFGPGGAFVAEAVISFIMMTTVLRVSSLERFAQYTGLAGGTLVALFISIESPLSGMSMNPARTLASAIPAHLYTSLWVYFTAPLLGMLSASELHLLARRPAACAKLHHQNSKRCIFCGFQMNQPTQLQTLTTQTQGTTS